MWTESSGWPAPAKLNLFLHICGRRADGYHELQTLFQLLDYGDRLDFVHRSDGVVRRLQGPAGVPEAQDLVVRAARLLQREAGLDHGVDIHLHKRLPMGGGLGGGSSDAATVLVALNRLWRAGLDQQALVDLGLRLGADVPVFVRGHSAWAEGVGERLTAQSLPPRWFLVLHPGVEVATAAVFGAPELTRNSPRIKIPAFDFGRTRNDCEPVVRVQYPEVGRALDWLGHYGQARLTGTGACVFAAFDDEARARQVLERVPAGWQAFVARGVDRSPLLARLAQGEQSPAARENNWGVAKR